MTRQRRILGMTSTQIGILIALGAAVCILFAIAGWLAMGGSIPLMARSTPVPQTTPTRVVMPTITATLSPTPVPYEQLIPQGWKQHKTDLVEIWLPSNFKKMGTDADEEIALIGSNSNTSLYQMTVTVMYEPMGTDSLDAYIDHQLVAIDPTIRVVERRKVSLNGIESVRMVFEARVKTVDVNELVYVFQDGTTVWAVFYVAQINEFYEMLTTFEQSAKTFRIVR